MSYNTLIETMLAKTQYEKDTQKGKNCIMVMSFNLSCENVNPLLYITILASTYVCPSLLMLMFTLIINNSIGKLLGRECLSYCKQLNGPKTGTTGFYY